MNRRREEQENFLFYFKNQINIIRADNLLFQEFYIAK